jgi:hypothetical protein
LIHVFATLALGAVFYRRWKKKQEVQVGPQVHSGASVASPPPPLPPTLPPTNAQQAQQQQQYSMPQQQQQQQQQHMMPQPLQLTPQQLQYLQQQQAIQLASFQQQQMPLTPELQAQVHAHCLQQVSRVRCERERRSLLVRSPAPLAREKEVVGSFARSARAREGGLLRSPAMLAQEKGLLVRSSALLFRSARTREIVVFRFLRSLTHLLLQLTMQIQQGLWGAPPQQPMGGAAPPPQLDEHEGQVLVNVPVYGGGGTVMTECVLCCPSTFASSNFSRSRRYKGKMISVEVPREAKGGSSLWVDVPMLYR